MHELYARLRRHIGEDGCSVSAGIGGHEDRTAGQRRTIPSHQPNSASFHGAFMIVDRLALVVVFGALARGGCAVIACDASSALKRRNSASSRVGAGRIAQAAVAQHQV